jgi:hypothetical protein
MSIKAIGIAGAIVAVAFGAGFAVGRGMLGELRTRIAEVESQADSLRNHLAESKVRGQLMDAMAGLREVALDVTDQNFGEAREVMRRVRETVTTAYTDAAHSETLRASLASVQRRLDEIEVDLQNLRTEARAKIDALVHELRRLVGQ